MTKMLVAHIADIDARGSRTYRHEELEIAIFKLSDGQIRAVENRCPHKGGKLSEGMVCGTAIHCPLHDWKIDLRTGNVYEPDDGCVTSYETEVDDAGSIFITI